MINQKRNPEIKNSISIRSRIIVIFSVFTLVFAVSIGFMYLINWMALEKETAELMSYDMNQEISKQIDLLIKEPYEMNEINQKLITSGIIDIANENIREKYFASVLQSSRSQIYGVTYGTESGELYGARRNEKGVLEIFKNNKETEGRSAYYYVNEDLTIGDFVMRTEAFDVRTRDWYITAKQRGKPTYVPIYKNLVVDDLTISAAWPIYDDEGNLEGVLATHMLLNDINQYLQDIVSQTKGYAYIVDKNTEELIGNSFYQENFKTLENGEIRRNKLSDIGNPDVIRGYEKYKETEEGHYLYQADDERYYINVTEYQVEGLDWLIVSAASSNIYMDRAVSNIQTTVLIIIIVLLLSIFAYYISTSRMIKPIKNLIIAMEQLSSGDLSMRVAIEKNDEIGTISNMFNQMADKMNQLVNNLEEKVEERTSQIHYLSCHDTLTGLMNRQYFEDTIKRIDTKASLPISIIFADVNGLKMVNDVFGHTSGDILIKKVADILKKSCRSEDTLARVGGDEFIVLLPNTEEPEVKLIVERIRKGLVNEKVNNIRCSIAIGYDTKTSSYEDIEKIMGNAENEMYKDKTFSRKSFADDAISTIIQSLQERNQDIKVHSNRVAELCERMGKTLGLPQPEIKRLLDAGLLHDIGKIVLENNLLNKKEDLTEHERQQLMQHTIVGYKILKLFDHTLDLADDVYAHHEKWDGSGYPKGLKGHDIPLNARIIALAENYDNKLSKVKEITPGHIDQILVEIQEEAGKYYDPELTKIFVAMIKDDESLVD
jgi:diguanylate cyclase (GGDEF)-like protein/putative nucleotidyltransferase with HDIG domain